MCLDLHWLVLVDLELLLPRTVWFDCRLIILLCDCISVGVLFGCLFYGMNYDGFLIVVILLVSLHLYLTISLVV